MEAKRKKLLTRGRPRMLKDVNGVKTETIYTSSVLPIKGEERSLIFDAPPQKGYVTDWTRAKIGAVVRITKSDGTALTATDLVCPQSFCLYTMFKDLQVLVNNHPVFYSRFMYPYYCNLLLNHKISDKEKTVVYSGALRFDDNADLDPIIEEEQDTTIPAASATGPPVVTKHVVFSGYSGDDVIDDWDARCARFAKSKSVELLGPVLFDLALQSRVLRDDAGLKLIFTPNTPKFCLLATALKPDYVLEITKAFLLLPRISVKPSYGLPTGDLSYYYVEHRLLALPVTKGSTNFSRALTQGQLPRRVIIQQIEEDGFNGDFHKSCFKFPHFNLTSCQAMFAGDRVPIDPLTMDFTTKEYLEAYISLYENLKNSLSFSGLGYTREEFADNRFMIALDATKDKEAGAEHYTEGSTGQLAVSLQWKKPLQENIVVLFTMEFERMCTLNKYGQPEILYAPVYGE